MKTFMPFLMVPLMGVAGWQLSGLHAPPLAPSLPTIAALDAPPALGLTMPYDKDRTPVKVSMRALLPPQTPGPVPVPTAAATPPATQHPPAVTAILIHGDLRVAQVAGKALAVGEGVAGYRVAAIETERVLFEHATLGQQRWVPVTTR